MTVTMLLAVFLQLFYMQMSVLNNLSFNKRIFLKYFVLWQQNFQNSFMYVAQKRPHHRDQTSKLR